ncbi:hypothetical protein DPX16_5723 [Anabarilius grahami]|uniref:Uncharacterized protein n=1 Tax=Anabarilius grahami TaxID=495550 RepID=A0A3N0YQ42_ANAGA|nr:hypothetical protein DPX16_5723 [Anabarilius grahami]
MLHGRVEGEDLADGSRGTTDRDKANGRSPGCRRRASETGDTSGHEGQGGAATTSIQGGTRVPEDRSGAGGTEEQGGAGGKAEPNRAEGVEGRSVAEGI